MHKTRYTPLLGSDFGAARFDQLIDELLRELQHEQGAARAPKLCSVVTTHLGAGDFLVTVIAD
jgi:hypothetical protein